MYYGLLKNGNIEKVSNVFDKKYILIANSKRALKMKLSWYLKNRFTITIKMKDVD